MALVCFPVVFIGELPDKTMFASLVMSTRGRPLLVWLGAAAAFVVHVAIATTVGVALFKILPSRALDAVVCAMFLFGAVYAWREGVKDERELVDKESSRHGVAITAFVVIFLAEWGDLTQILTANLAARYHAPLSVAVGSILALWTVAALAVASGQTLLRFVDVSTIRRVTAVVLVALAAFTAWAAIRSHASRQRLSSPASSGRATHPEKTGRPCQGPLRPPPPPGASTAVATTAYGCPKRRHALRTVPVAGRKADVRVTAMAVTAAASNPVRLYLAWAACAASSLQSARPRASARTWPARRTERSPDRS